jgi:hypothetical protein
MAIRSRRVAGVGAVTGEQAERPQRTNRNQVKGHHPGLAQRQRFQHGVRLGRIGHVQQEDRALAVRAGEPLVDLAGEIQRHRVARLERHDGTPFFGRRLVGPTSEREQARRGRRAQGRDDVRGGG